MAKFRCAQAKIGVRNLKQSAEINTILWLKQDSVKWILFNVKADLPHARDEGWGEIQTWPHA
jgi:hypothetical protein